MQGKRSTHRTSLILLISPVHSIFKVDSPENEADEKSLINSSGMYTDGAKTKAKKGEHVTDFSNHEKVTFRS